MYIYTYLYLLYPAYHVPYPKNICFFIETLMIKHQFGSLPLKLIHVIIAAIDPRRKKAGSFQEPPSAKVRRWRPEWVNSHVRFCLIPSGNQKWRKYSVKQSLHGYLSKGWLKGKSSTGNHVVLPQIMGSPCSFFLESRLCAHESTRFQPYPRYVNSTCLSYLVLHPWSVI